jgi:hypothetical protein
VVKHNQRRVNNTFNANLANYRLSFDAVDVRVHPPYFGEETVCTLVVIALQLFNMLLLLVKQRLKALDLLATSVGGSSTCHHPTTCVRCVTVRC